MRQGSLSPAPPTRDSSLSVRCRGCGHKYLLAYSCKGRYICTSCHTKRAVAFAEWMHSRVLWPVAHRQIVLTIPKMLRGCFRYDRRLLGNLCRVAAGVPAESFRVLLSQPAAEPGLVICVHTFGNLGPGPFSMKRIRYDPDARTVIYKTKMVAGPNRNFEIFDPLDFLAAVTSHIPNRGEHLVRYYGWLHQRAARRAHQARMKIVVPTSCP